WTYVDQNNWTWDTWKDVLVQLTRDFNGDGVIDQWGVASEDMAGALIASNGAVCVDVTGEKPRLAMEDPKVLRALTFMTDLYNVYKVTIEQNKLSAGRAFFEMPKGDLAMYPYGGAYGDWLVQNGMKWEQLGWVYMPKGPDTSDYGLLLAGGPSMTVVYSLAKDPAAIVQVMQDYICTWDSGENFGISPNTFYAKDIDRWMPPDARARQLYFEGGLKSFAIYHLHYNLHNLVLNPYYTQLIRQQTTVTGGMAAIVPKLQAQIDSYNPVK
ncbi:MAG TPA: hypothetical protein DD727_03685, partial [Clostridiales bacterium]|nr:hypothetical protein [Clostridiales bacterium]